MKRNILILLAVAALAGFAQTVVFEDDMTNFPTGWRLVRSSGDYWARMSTRSKSPDYSAKCTYRSTYSTNQNTWMVRRIDLAPYTAAKLHFWSWVNTEPSYDYLRLEFHDTNGWRQVWLRTGHDQTWDSTAIDVPVATDSIRFRFTSDAQQQYEGVYVDDVVLISFRPDVRMTTILAPAGEVDSGTTVVPACSVHNPTPLEVNYRVLCRIGADYVDTAYVSNHEGFESRTVYFRGWDAHPRGTVPVQCSTMLTGDDDNSNDFAEAFVEVNVNDVGCVRVLQPVGDIDSGYAMTPQVVVRNHGTSTQSFFTGVYVGAFYSRVVEIQDLAPGDTQVISYVSRIVTGPRGPDSVIAVTYLLNDMNAANDTTAAGIDICVHDIGAALVIAPPPVVDSGDAVVPEAQFWNHGTETETFECSFTIGGEYVDTARVGDLAPNTGANIQFRNWPARPGYYRPSVEAMLQTDLVELNDAISSNLFVRFLDAGVSRILAPHTRVLPGNIIPRVEVINPGNMITGSCTLELTIEPGGYRSTHTVFLEPDQQDTILLASWTAASGTYQATAVIRLPGDMNATNDTVTKEVVVGGTEHDVGVTGFIVPTALVDPGDIRPEVYVYNYGSVAETNVPVWVRVEYSTDQVFEDSVTLSRIEPGEELPVRFATWLAYTGDFDVCSWTGLGDDQSRGNDTAMIDVEVVLHSVAPVEVIAPTGTIGEQHPIHPKIRIRNRGSIADSIPVGILIEYEILPVRRDSAVVYIEPGGTADVLFGRWTPVLRGDYQITAWTGLANDYHPDDDTIWDAFAVGEAIVDAAAREIVAPSGSVDPGEIAPRILVGNAGTVETSFWAYLSINRAGTPVYVDSTWVNSLMPGRERVESLPAWQATGGSYSLAMVVVCAGDINNDNDKTHGSCIVAIGGEWIEKASMPLGPSGKTVKRGGWLEYLPATDLIYAAKGYKTTDFYSYDRNSDEWALLAGMPYTRHPLWLKKPPRKGSRGVSDGENYFYVTQGNNSLGFWRYAAGGDSWKMLTDVPLGVNRKKVKGGTDLAYVTRGDTGWVYLLKGYRTEFYRYNTIADRWDSLPEAPRGIRNKWDKGSWLVFNGDNRLYAHKAKYHELWRFDIDAGDWDTTQLTGMPLVSMMGRRKKSKDGGSSAYIDGTIFALKGGNTQEVWAYAAGSDIWIEVDTIPSNGSSGKKKVKHGADITSADGLLYALKGNKTTELWRYAPDVALLGGQPRREGIAGRTTGLERAFDLRISPNPARGVANLVCRAPNGGPARIELFDAAGRLQHRQTLPTISQHGTRVRLGVSALARGCYFVRLAADGRETVRKLVIE